MTEQKYEHKTYGTGYAIDRAGKIIPLPKDIADAYDRALKRSFDECKEVTDNK